MTNRYYRNEYSDNQWKVLIDNAIAVGCTVSYGRYGNIATIDSTDAETRLCQGDEQYRLTWAEHIHSYVLNEMVRKEERI